MLGNDFDSWAEVSMPRVSGLSDLFDERLPINRKERYYTGTVLPMIVASDGFKHFGRFLALCGMPAVALESDPAASNVQFFSEYGFKESLMDGAEERFRDPVGRDTPDLVVYVERSLLLGVEAKFFDRPSNADLQKQLERQAQLLSVMADGVGTQPLVRQVALLPAGLGMPERIGDVPVLTWERVSDTFRDVASPYWIEVLDLALNRYDRLAGRPGGRQNSNAVLAGKRILDDYKTDDAFAYTWIGRRGGLDGPEFREDVETGAWENREYEVRYDCLLDNPNWFPIADFIKKVERSG